MPGTTEVIRPSAVLAAKLAAEILRELELRRILEIVAVACDTEEDRPVRAGGEDERAE